MLSLHLQIPLECSHSIAVPEKSLKSVIREAWNLYSSFVHSYKITAWNSGCNPVSAVCVVSTTAKTGVSSMGQWAVVPPVCQWISLPFIAQVPGVVVLSRVQWFCVQWQAVIVSVHWHLQVWKDNHHLRILLRCFYSGVMGHVHTSSSAVKNETFSPLAHCLELQLVSILESCIYSEFQTNSVK